MHIHILGICGTFMGGLALIARAAGHQVSGSDANVYPPMSTLLESQGVDLREGYEISHLDDKPDLVVVGNVMSRGKPVVEHILNQRIPYTSGPQWLSEHVLRDKWVICASGTHGKTTTSGMVTWILEECGLNPGYLIGGVPGNFETSARLTDSPFFVIEADEYDTAFFDKRSKFVHYQPRTAILNNLEFDHADIFENLVAIQRQFHHFVRLVPSQGLIISNGRDANLDAVLEQGCWSPVERFDAAEGWQAELLEEDGSRFKVSFQGEHQGEVSWSLIGEHNVSNALAAIAAARHAGVPAHEACAALGSFSNAKRRLELRGEVNGIRVYDDFAHHPTAIRTTLDGLRKRVGEGRILAVLEPRSNTMRMGVHQGKLAASWCGADSIELFEPEGMDWSLAAESGHSDIPSRVHGDVQAIIDTLVAEARPGDSILIMSNGGFDGIHTRLLQALEASA
ncbi:MAG: UDP-N-acetylmuramate:L-alanyl-gamma-D-glutamyl-meso-diaminopimelate ligase [Gammaproteobacteria bacterium]